MSETDDYPYLIEDAILMAALLHHGQKDRAGRAYIEHPLRVSRSPRLQHDMKLRVAAVLHDVIEDTDADEEVLNELFPDDVVKTIVTLTRKPKGETYTQFIERIAMDPRARLVKLADLDDNTSKARRESLTDSLRARYRAAYLLLGETPPSDL